MRGAVLGHGMDLVENGRIAGSLRRFGDRFLERVYTAGERAYCGAQMDAVPHLAVRWAAKEAVAKAFGTGIGGEIGWLDIEVVRDGRGCPGVVLHGAGLRLAEGRGVGAVRVSLSHTKEYAVASVILLGREEGEEAGCTGR